MRAQDQRKYVNAIVCLGPMPRVDGRRCHCTESNLRVCSMLVGLDGNRNASVCDVLNIIREFSDVFRSDPEYLDLGANIVIHGWPAPAHENMCVNVRLVEMIL